MGNAILGCDDRTQARQKLGSTHDLLLEVAQLYVISYFFTRQDTEKIYDVQTDVMNFSTAIVTDALGLASIKINLTLPSRTKRNLQAEHGSYYQSTEQDLKPLKQLIKALYKKGAFKQTKEEDGILGTKIVLVLLKEDKDWFEILDNMKSELLTGLKKRNNSPVLSPA